MTDGRRLAGGAPARPLADAKTTKYADQSLALLAFQMSAEAQQILATDKTKFVINIQTAKDAQKGFSAPPPAHVARAAQTMSFAQDLRFIEPWAEYQQKIDDELSKAYLGQVSMAQAAKSATAAGDWVLAQSSQRRPARRTASALLSEALRPRRGLRPRPRRGPGGPGTG